MIVRMTQNDTRPYLRFTVSQNGSAVDLTGASVVFSMANQATGALQVNREDCVIVTAGSGIAEYRWSASDTTTTGRFRSEVEVTLSDGSILSLPPDGDDLIIIIREEVA